MDLHTMMRPRKLCLCKSVTREDIYRTIDEGAESFLEVVAKTGASTKCGTCQPEVYAVCKEAFEKKRAASTGQKLLEF